MAILSRESFDYGLLTGRRHGATVELFITRQGDTFHGAIGISPTGERFEYLGRSRFGDRPNLQPFYVCCKCRAEQHFVGKPTVQICVRCDAAHGWMIPAEFKWRKL